MLPHWVVSLPEAERVMRENGYRLAMRATDDFTFNVDNYDAEHRVPHMANLLFVRSELSTSGTERMDGGNAGSPR
jgi:hypothetical protein